MKGFVKLGDSTIVNDVRENLISYFDYSLLAKGNHIPVSTGDSTLTLVSDPRYAAGRVWAFPNDNLVWETGVSAVVSSGTPNTYPGVSGIYINGTFYNRSTSGQYAYYIDHLNGKVVFNSGISTSSIIRANYSYKYVNICKSDGLPWFKRLSQDNNVDILPENKIKPPVIGIELVGRRMSPYQLGGGQTVKTDYLFHCVSEDPYIRDSMVDVVSYQQNLSFYMADLNALANSGTFPLDYRGVPISGALPFPLLAIAHQGRLVYIGDTILDSSYTIGRLHVGTVKVATEVIHFGV